MANSGADDAQDQLPAGAAKSTEVKEKAFGGMVEEALKEEANGEPVAIDMEAAERGAEAAVDVEVAETEEVVEAVDVEVAEMAAEAAIESAVEAAVEAAEITATVEEELGLDIDMAEPLGEIERHVALAAMALGGRMLGSANASDTFNVAQRVLSAVKNSTANAIGNASSALLNSSMAAIGNASGALLNASIAAVANANVSDMLDAVQNTTAGVVDNVRNANVSDMLDAVQNTTAGVVDNVRNANVSEMIDTVQNTTAGVIEDVSTALENVSLGNFTSDMMNVVRENAADIFENINLLIDAIGPFLSPALAKKHGMLMRVEDIFQATGVRGEEAGMAAHAFQGDMVPESDSQLELFQSITAGKRGPHVAAGKPWTGGIVKYCYASDVGADVQGHFEAAVEQVVRATCLQFENVGWQFGDSTTDSAEQRCNEQPAIFVMSRPDYGCYSVVGESWMPSQQLQLQHPGCTTQGVILHEIGHALGMAHEHARPDRDQYIQVNWDNIQPQWTSAFDISEDAYVDLPYEYLSLMHYDPYAFAADRNLPTIEAAGGHNGDIGQRNGFAAADIDQLIVMYQEEVPGCTGREIEGTGCVDMPDDNGGDICSGLTVCGGIQNERCCACGGGIEVQCYQGETCPNPPRVPRTNHIDCITDATPLFPPSPQNPCIIHNQCDMELKFKCRETCTHTISSQGYQADFCHELPVTDICALRDECEVWDPSVVAQFAEPTAEVPEVQRTAVEDTPEAESSSWSWPFGNNEEEEVQNNVVAEVPEVQRTAVEETPEAESSSFVPEETQEAIAEAEKAVADAEDALEVAKEAAQEAGVAEEAVEKAAAAAASEEEAEKAASAEEAAKKLQADAKTGICPRPDGFCLHAGSTYVDDEDCDGDGIPDPYCSDDTEQSGFFGSASGCESTWPTGVCGEKVAVDKYAEKEQQGSTYHSVAVATGALSIIVAGFAAQSYWAAAGAAAVAA